jgi:hypothetical protein
MVHMKSLLYLLLGLLKGEARWKEGVIRENMLYHQIEKPLLLNEASQG